MVRAPTDQPPVHPGEALREDFLSELGLDRRALAERLRVAGEVVDEILAERRDVTPELALRLGRLFGQTPAFWMSLQLAYDLYQAEHAESARDLTEIEPIRRMG